jgi:hypothetical protein
VSAGVQTTLAIGGYALPVDPVRLAAEPGDIFTVRHILRGLDLDDEQIAVAEEAVGLVRQGVYPREVA